MFKSFSSVHADPFQDSVFATLAFPGVSPPKANASVLVVPVPVNCLLAVFKSATSVHEVPFQFSVTETLESPEALPPKSKAASLSVPAFPLDSLAVFKSATSVQLVPFQLSFIAVTPPGVLPAKANAEV